MATERQAMNRHAKFVEVVDEAMKASHPGEHGVEDHAMFFVGLLAGMRFGSQYEKLNERVVRYLWPVIDEGTELFPTPRVMDLIAQGLFEDLLPARENPEAQWKWEGKPEPLKLRFEKDGTLKVDVLVEGETVMPEAEQPFDFWEGY